MTPEVQSSLTKHNVSRETLDRLEAFVLLLEKWNPKINLVSKSTLPDVWQRHVLDSAQLHPFIGKKVCTLVDIGSGGGFPGLVLAALLNETHPGLSVSMIESDRRKCAFLRTALAEMGVSAEVYPERVEALPPRNADLLTSRALAPLTKLLGFAERHLSQDGQALFLKGANAEAEVNEALASWRFDLQKKPSETSVDAVVLEISNLRSR